MLDSLAESLVEPEFELLIDLDVDPLSDWLPE
jgi:hypothetical protein